MFYLLNDFNYYKVRNLDELLDLISKLDDFKILAGGTDLLIDMRIGRYRPKNIIDINEIKELQYIVRDKNIVKIGALTRLEELLNNTITSETLPLLHKAIYHMASWQIRVRATIGGNLCNASPAADTAPPLLVYNAELVLTSISNERVISIHEFFKGPRKTILAKNEILREIRIPIETNYGFSYKKFGRRNSFTLSIVSVACLVKIADNRFNDVRIALGSVAPTPIRAKTVEEYLIDRNVNKEIVYQASKLVVNDIAPISDIRASAEYRKKLSIILVRDALMEAIKMVRI